MVLVIHPGDPSIREDPVTGFSSKKMSTVDAFLDLIRWVYLLKTNGLRVRHIQPEKV